ncbi:MAG: YifB family Mg chelatase-like AAA ATPase [Rickettsiales bacterium]|jgi:magnesium chelatase family protein|nr:YifB family Mg chelatase-like AAA ATPase [Rickettsiales bacterium]
MTANINTIVFNGLEITRVEAQAQISHGMVKFFIVGLADRAVKEASTRIESAFKAMNLSIPAKKVVVNLAPADLTKTGAHFDLPILCAVLAAMGVLPEEELAKYVIMGEVGLDGTILRANGVLPASIWANDQGLGIICPVDNMDEAKWAGNKNILAAGNVLDLVNWFRHNEPMPAPETTPPPLAAPLHRRGTDSADMSEVKGQAAAKRALEIAAAGGHAMLMVGPPGAGKSMLASRLGSILPPMTQREVLDTSVIYSVAGLLKGGGLMNARPFRAVHHTASQIALSGGGSNALPGEISLAHNGVLFLDELPEFQRGALEILRQPMETGGITISRAKRNATYPAQFQLIAAMNPCPCGHLGNAKLSCSKAPRCAEAYQNKISGPLMDRIDLHVEVDSVNPWELGRTESAPEETSAAIRARTCAARERQIARSVKLFGREILNARLDGRELETATALTQELRDFINLAAEKMSLSARGYNRVLRIARTIADLRGAENIIMEDIAEALTYRSINRGKFGA